MLRQIVESIDAMRRPTTVRHNGELAAGRLEVDAKTVWRRLRQFRVCRRQERTLTLPAAARVCQVLGLRLVGDGQAPAPAPADAEAFAPRAKPRKAPAGPASAGMEA